MHQHQPVVTPEHPVVDDEGGYPKRPGGVRLRGGLGEPPFRPKRGKLACDGAPGLLVGNAVVLGPAFGVVATVVPIILARDGLPLEGAYAAQLIEVDAVKWAPEDLATRLAFELPHLGGGQVGVAAAD